MTTPTNNLFNTPPANDFRSVESLMNQTGTNPKENDQPDTNVVRMFNDFEDKIKDRFEEADGNLDKTKQEIMQEMKSMKLMMEKAVEQFSAPSHQYGGKISLELLDRVRSIYRANFKVEYGEGFDLSKRFIHTDNLEIVESITHAIIEEGKFTNRQKIKAACRRTYETKMKAEKTSLMDDNERKQKEQYQRRYSRRDRLWRARNKQVKSLEQQITPEVYRLWQTKANAYAMSDEESEEEDKEQLIRRSPTWRDPNLTILINNLPVKKGKVKKSRILGPPSERPPPCNDKEN